VANPRPQPLHEGPELPILEPLASEEPVSMSAVLPAASEAAVLGSPVPAAERRGLLWRAALPSLALAGGIGALDFLRSRFQHAQTFLPERYPNGIWQPQTYGVKAEDVFFRAEDGVELHAWWIPIRRARGTVLYCHGNAGNITSRIGIYRFLRKAKVNVLAFDYRGYGRSGGRPSEQGVFLDARAAWDFLTGELGEAPERIVLFGHSLGGAIAIDCAVHRSVAGLVAQSTFTDLREMARVRFPRIPLHLVARNQFRSFEKVSKLEVPKLFIHGTADETIPFQLGQRLFENAAAPKEWYAVPHAGHNDIVNYGGVRYLWRIARFAGNALKAAKKNRLSARAVAATAPIV
jgi:pimeloyl-ACP methyl ester carboxylesterase